MTKTK